MKLVLMDRGLWGYATGEEVAPVTTETDKNTLFVFLAESLMDNHLSSFYWCNDNYL